MKASTLFPVFFASAMALVPFACSDAPELIGLEPPTGTGAGGKYDPGNGGLTGATTTGTGMPPVLGFDWRDAILYFVFVDRFLDGDPTNNGTPTAGVNKPADYQGGDFAGVLQKIKDGYFTSLGVNALWLTVPIDNTEDSGQGTKPDTYFYSAYHGYWPKDLDKTEEHFGSMAELKAVVDAAHAANIKVILDYAMNHVHISSPVYAAHPDWFWPLAYTGGDCLCSGPVCSYDDDKTRRRCWFTSYLPDFNFTVPAARDYSVSNAISWIKNTGADGFRLDAVKHIEDQWILDLRSRVTKEIEPMTGQHFYMVGETFTGDKKLLKYYVDPLKMLDGQFDFPFRAAVISAVLSRTTNMQNLEFFLKSNQGLYGSGLMSTFLGNHDVPRSIHFAQDTPLWSGDPWNGGKDLNWMNQPNLPSEASAFERMANAFTLLLTTPGLPLIYYGDEVGMPGAGDPDNRRMMQWPPDGGDYSPGQKFLLDKVKKLNAIRSAHSALRRGVFTSLGAAPDTLTYKMVDGSDVVYVLMNRSDVQQSVGGLPSGALKDLLGGGTANGPTVTLQPRSSMVLVP